MPLQEPYVNKNVEQVYATSPFSSETQLSAVFHKNVKSPKSTSTARRFNWEMVRWVQKED